MRLSTRQTKPESVRNEAVFQEGGGSASVLSFINSRPSGPSLEEMACYSVGPLRLVWMSLLWLLLSTNGCSGGQKAIAIPGSSLPVRLGLRGGGGGGGGGGAKGGKSGQAFKPPNVGERCTVTSTIKLHEMAKFPKDAETVRKGMEHLWMVSVNAEKQKRIGSFKGGCKALITALQNHWKDKSVMIETLSLACNLAYAQPNTPMGARGWSHIVNQDEIGRMGGVRYVTNTMKQHETAEEIQSLGIRALANLAYNHTENAARVVKWGGIEAVLEAMRIHKDSFAVQEAGCIFVWSCLVSIKNETHITYGYNYMGAPGGGAGHVDLQIAGRIAELGGVQVVAEALSRFGHVTEFEDDGENVGEQGCAALWFLGSKPGRLRDSVREAGGIELAKTVIRTQRNASLCAATWGARLLEQLTGKNCSKYMMDIQIPSPDVLQDQLDEIKTGVKVCRPYCGCDEVFGPGGIGAAIQMEEEEEARRSGREGCEKLVEDEIDAAFADEDEETKKDRKRSNKKKRKRGRLVVEKVDSGEDGEGEAKEGGEEGGDDDDEMETETDDSGARAEHRAHVKQESKRFKLNVKRFRDKDKKARADLQAAEEKRHRRKTMTAQQIAEEKEAQGIYSSSDMGG